MTYGDGIFSAYYNSRRDDADPLGIAGLVAWHPLDKRRVVLPTGQVLVVENTSGAASYSTFHGVPSMQWTATASPSDAWQGEGAGGYRAGNGFTLSLWYYGGGVSGANILQLRRLLTPTAETGNGYLLLNVPSSGVRLSEYTTASTVVLTAALSRLSSGWNNLLATGTAAGALTLYINGTSRATGTASASFAGYIGGRITIPNYAATCRLAGLRLYDRVLTSAERTKILNEYN